MNRICCLSRLAAECSTDKSPTANFDLKMAILAALPNLKVSVCVDNKALEEYDDDEEIVSEKPGPIGEYQAAKTVSKYIEALSSKEFTIDISLGAGLEINCSALSFPVYMDGGWVAAPLLDELTTHPKQSRLHGLILPVNRVIRGSYIAAPGKPDEQLLKKFRFQKIESSIIPASPSPYWY